MVVKRNDPVRLRMLRGCNLRSPHLLGRNHPKALVKEKCVSAFEFNRITPRPSSRSGGSDNGKTAAHNSFTLRQSRPTDPPKPPHARSQPSRSGRPPYGGQRDDLRQTVAVNVSPLPDSGGSRAHRLQFLVSAQRFDQIPRARHRRPSSNPMCRGLYSDRDCRNALGR